MSMIEFTDFIKRAKDHPKSRLMFYTITNAAFLVALWLMVTGNEWASNLLHFAIPLLFLVIFIQCFSDEGMESNAQCAAPLWLDRTYDIVYTLVLALFGFTALALWYAGHRLCIEVCINSLKDGDGEGDGHEEG